ncbi:MAG: hypothetical protein UZ19_OD1000709 [Parcubacteria bacterium OLB19]|nr:MAG: hypothetical protein UZ19_OD1000709 [Parcubacteria bacterium OLB19]
MHKKPLTRVISGSGTYVDPHVVRNDVAFELDQIPESGYDYELPQIKKVRDLFEQTEMTDEQRQRFALRIDTKELRCRAMRPRYLLRRAEEVNQTKSEKAVRFRQEAQIAYVDFKKFVREHLELTAKHQSDPVLSKLFQPIQELE